MTAHERKFEPLSEPEGVVVRDWEPGNASTTDSLLSVVWGHDPSAHAVFAAHGPARDEPGRISRTLVAEIGGCVVGVATAREYRLHPARWRFVLHVHPEYRCRGIGSALFDQLIAVVASRDFRPLQAATRADDDEGRSFLNKHGFRLLMRTRLGTLNPEAVDRRQWRELKAAIARVMTAGYCIVTMSDLESDPANRRLLARLHEEIYRRNHGWNPPASISEVDAQRIFLGEDLVPQALFVAVMNDIPVGVASLRRAESRGQSELGWVGTIAEETQDVDLTAALVGRCLEYAREQHLLVQVEVDEADRHLWRLIAKLPVEEEPDWLTFVRSNPLSANRT